jgi:hypothetical protein
MRLSKDHILEVRGQNILCCVTKAWKFLEIIVEKKIVNSMHAHVHVQGKG